ncbi:MAG: polynucleotide adenylyltransferase PcnB [Chlamydiales bacterium]|nr:polynucleotide adenylyltransferase PcnB [Chlamydiales bacterium]
MKEKIYTSKEHHIRNDLIDPNALLVLKKLHEAGFTAYLVGGGVRDLLMRKKPKDFDISTSAKPEEIKALFQRNCLLIGRRFRLAHIRFGRHIIEVSTFRAGDPTDEELIIQDNIWGTPEEDVLRRDFTINGLFYDPLDHKIIDYVGGFEDLKEHCLRAIGDPELRFKQDPVRMIRMQKFRARFGFHVDPRALEALKRCRKEIIKSSPARVLEEIFRMLESGASEPFFRLLVESKFLEILFPPLNVYFHQPIGELLYSYLKAADSMNTQGRYQALDRAVLTAALIYPILEQEIGRREKIPNIGEVMGLSYDLIQKLLFEPYSHFPRKIRLRCHFILHMQYRLTPLDKKKRARSRIVKQKGFIYALIFLKLRALVHPDLFKIYEHWKRLLKKEEKEREKRV